MHENFERWLTDAGKLHRIAVRDEVREQLTRWTEDFEAEAEAVEKAADYRAFAGARNEAA